MSKTTELQRQRLSYIIKYHVYNILASVDAGVFGVRVSLVCRVLGIGATVERLAFGFNL